MVNFVNKEANIEACPNLDKFGDQCPRKKRKFN
jgi:hypothetical protein